MESGLQIFSNEELGLKTRTVLNEDGSISVNAEDVAIGFGWFKTETKNGRKYKSIRWKRMNDFSKEMGFDHEWSKDEYMPESLFYRLAMKANNDKAEKFQNWIAFDVVPSIRKNGKYEYKKKQPTSLELANQMLNALNEQNKKIEECEQGLNSVNSEIEEINRKIDVIGAYQNSSMYTRLKRLCSSRVMTLLSNDVYKVLWSPYFYIGIHNSLAKHFNVANTKLIKTEDLEEAKNFIIHWHPSDHYIQEKTNELIKKRDAGNLKENRVMALKIWLMDTDSGKNNPF